MSFWEHSGMDKTLRFVEYNITRSYLRFKTDFRAILNIDVYLHHIIHKIAQKSYMSFWEHSKLNHLSDTSDFQCKINSSWIISQCSEKWANFEWKASCETIFRKNSEIHVFEKYQNNYMWIFCEFVKVCVRFHKELQFCVSLCDFGHFCFGIFLGQMGQMKNNLTQAFLTIWPKIFPFFIF